MTILEMLEQSSVLTLLGMGIVFSFLIILIVCVTLMGKFFHVVRADKNVQQPATTQSPAAGAGNAAVTAAISAAVNEYRKTNS